MKSKYEEELKVLVPYFKLSRCSKVRKHDLDERLLLIINSKVFKQLKSFYEEMPSEYWSNLKMLDFSPDTEELKKRCIAFKTFCKEVFKTDETSTQEDQEDEKE